jgi:hypothetical protein
VGLDPERRHRELRPAAAVVPVVIVLVAVIVGAVAVFGIGTARVALTDVAVLETQEAAQRGAEAAAGRAADMKVAGTSTEVEIDAAARTEATNVIRANLSRGSIGSVSVLRTSSASEFVRIDLTLVSSYGGFIGPRILTATGSVVVPQP